MKNINPFKRYKSLNVITLALAVLPLTSVIQPNTSTATIETEDTKKITTYMITTRDKQNYEGMLGPGYGSNYSFLNINQIFEECPSEVVIFVHGWDNNETKAKERFDRVKLSLEKNYYNYSLVGFSWKSDTEWQAAKSIAKWNGPRLADFIFKLMNNCKEEQPDKEVKIRLIAHSLGARVVLSGLESLHKNVTWNNNNLEIASVHLLGAAVDDEEVSKNPQDILDDITNWGTLKSDYGSAIEEQVVIFHNLFNSYDNIFEPNLIPAFQVYTSFEGDLALGFNGSQLYPKTISLPTNYHQKNVSAQIPYNIDADDDGVCDLRTPITEICTITGVGDNHGGYIGFRNSTTTLVNDGAIDLVVDDWNNITINKN